MTIGDVEELERKIDERISQAEARLMRWFIGTLVGIGIGVATILVSAGRTLQRVEHTETRLTIIETHGSAPLRERLAAMDEKLNYITAILKVHDQRLETKK